jgi:hypothetical protein
LHQHIACRKFRVPDIIHQEDIIRRGSRRHGRCNLIVQRIVSYVLDLDLDIRIGFVELANDGIHLVDGGAGLFHCQHTNSDRTSRWLGRATYRARQKEHYDHQHDHGTNRFHLSLLLIMVDLEVDKYYSLAPPHESVSIRWK